MIEIVEWINWSKILKSYGWYKELKEKIKQGEFRHPYSSMVGGISKELNAAKDEFENTLCTRDELVNFIGWMNARIQDQAKVRNKFYLPHDGSYEVWLRINGLTLCLKFEDEYSGGGMISFGGSVRYFDKEGDDATWIALLKDLSKVGKGEAFFGMDEDFYPEEYF